IDPHLAGFHPATQAAAGKLREHLGQRLVQTHTGALRRHNRRQLLRGAHSQPATIRYTRGFSAPGPPPLQIFANTMRLKLLCFAILLPAVLLFGGCATTDADAPSSVEAMYQKGMRLLSV